MPGIPLVTRETSNYSRSTDQMCRQDSRVHLSAEEEIAAEESLSIYCKPVELYNILQRRAIRNPLFLQRCLNYKIMAKHKRRIQMTISLCRTVTENHSVFPLYIFLGRLICDAGAMEYSAVYNFSRICVLTNSSGVEGSNQVQAKFILPEAHKLAVEAKSRTLAILFVSFVGVPESSTEVNAPQFPLDTTSFASTYGGCCLCGEIPLESLYVTWKNSQNFGLGQGAEIMSTVDLRPCFLKPLCLNEDKCISIARYSSETMVCSGLNFNQPKISKQIQIIISAKEFGAKEKSPYNAYACGDRPSSSFSHIIRMREGNVVFNYRYYNNKLQRTEVTEDFSCPFCLVKCASFKGVRYHLCSSHDLFNFEFWVTEEYQAVNVSVKSDIWRSEIVADSDDPKLQPFFFCKKTLKRRRPNLLSLRNAKHVNPFALESGSLGGDTDLLDKADDAHSSRDERANFSGISSATLQSCADPDCVQSISGNSLAAPAMLQFAKTRKLYVERSESKNYALLRKRQFFHSHRAQPMLLEQVLSDQDSEDEVDDDVADFEDRRMLDDFVDVTKDEKQIMHMWNSFVRKQRVLADGHIPWSCEAFSKLHGPNLVQAPALTWCWRLFLVKLWNHGLLDARTMNECNLILEQCQRQNLDPNG